MAVETLEGLEHAFGGGYRNAGTFVCERNDKKIAIKLAANLDRADRCVFFHVRQKIRGDLRERIAIDEAFSHRASRAAHLDLAARKRRSELLDDGIDHRRRIAGAGLHIDPPSIAARERKHIFDQAAKPARLLADETKTARGS